MAFYNGLKVLFFVWLCSLCYAQLSPDELRQVEYHVGNEKINVDITKEGSSTENDTPQNIPKGNEIEEPFKKQIAHCLGCVINVPINQPAVTAMAERAVSTMDEIVAALTIHATPKVLGVQKQVVNGIQYYIQINVSLSDCPRSTTSTRDHCNPLPDSPSLICEVIFLDQPWNNPVPQLMGNNCTDANSDNDVENYTPDDLVAVERSAGSGNMYILSQEAPETTTEEKQEATTVSSEDETFNEDEDRNGQKVNGATGMTKAMDSSEIDLINELADIAVRTLNELDVGGSRKEVIDIVDAKKQIVNGLMYHLVLRVGSKSCAEEAECLTQGWTSQSICNVQLHRSWAGDTPYKAKVVKSECEEAWEEDRKGRQLSDNWVSQDMYDPEYNDCIKAVLSKAYNIVPKEKVTLIGLLKNVEPKNIELIAELKLDSDKWTVPKLDKKEFLILRPKVSCSSETEKSSLKVEKEAMPGAPMQADLNNAFINDIANFALEELDKESNSPNKRIIVRIVEATTQVVAGKSVNIKMELLPTDCPKGLPSANECNVEKGQDSEICTVVVLDQSWVPKRKLERGDCVPSTEIPLLQSIVGGFPDADKNSPGVQAAVDYAVGELNRRSNSIYKLNAVGVLEAKQQVVSGILYHLELALLPSSCKKDQPGATDCEFLVEAPRQKCSVKVWSQPWINKMFLTDVQCGPPAAFSKKSFSAVPDQPFSDINRRLDEAIEFAVEVLNNASTSACKEELKQVVEVNQEYGDGVLYDLKLRLIQKNCRKDDDLSEQDSERSTEKSQVCSMKVWAKPISWWIEMWMNDMTCVEEGVVATRARRSTETERPAVFGGISNADINSDGVKEASDYALNELNKRENSTNMLLLEEVVEAMRQVVAGISYHLTLKVVESNCSNAEESTNCQPLPDGKREVCFLKVWSKPWVNETSLHDVECKTHPVKRSAENILGGVSNADRNDAGVKEATDYAVLELSKRESVNSKLVLQEIVNAQMQVVAGFSYHLTLRVAESNCHKNESSATNCQALPDGKREVCSLKVWSKPSNEKSLHDVDCKAQPTKRSDEEHIVGGINDVDANSPEVRAAVNFAVKELDKSSNSMYKQKAVEVIEAKHQLVAGSLYHLKLKLVDTNCKKDEQSSTDCEPLRGVNGQICSLKVWSRPWLNETTLTDVDCKPVSPDGSVAGGIRDVDKNSPEVMEAVEFAVTELDKGTNSMYKKKVIEVIKAQRQTVAGTLYHLTLNLTDSNCRKRDQNAVAQCEVLPNGDGLICSVKVWSRPWLNATSLTEVNCSPDRAVQSPGNNVLGGARDVDTNSPDVRVAVEFAVSELDKSSNSIYKQKAVEVIEAKHQLVAGSLYHLKLRIADTNCRKTDLAATACETLPNVDGQICTLKVWSRPWFNEMSISEVNCSPAPAKGSVGGGIPGGLNDADKNSPEVKAAVEYAVKELDKISNSIYKQEVIEIIEAKQQIVAGVMYHLKLRVAETNYTKDNHSSTAPEQSPNVVGQVCTLKVWSRPWLNQTSVSDVSCGPARSRRSVDNVGSVHNANTDSTVVKVASNFAVQQWEKAVNSVYKHRVVKVIEAKEQVVSGVSYQLKLKVQATNCSKDDPSAQNCVRVQTEPLHICSAEVLFKPWLNEVSLGSVDCQPIGTEKPEEGSLIGGMKDIEDPLDPYIQDVAEYSRNEIDMATNSMYIQKVVRVIEARKQIVSGVLVHLKLELIRTGCTKKTKDLSNCEALPGQKSQICEVKIWDRPWLQLRRIRDLKCADAHIISSHEQSADTAENLFSAFVGQYNKSYESEVERKRRFEIFKENLNTIKELQDTERGTATYGPTMFADLTHEEFKRHYLGLRPGMQQENSVPYPKAEIPDINLPKEFDWRDHDAVTPVKNQGMCGSCWAFSVTGDIEGQYAIKYNKLLSFSEQELVDCDKLDDACQGGLPDNAYRALEQLGGLELEEDYPYDGHKQSCSLNKTLTRVHIHGALNISSNETDMAKWLVQHGPISIGINANAMQFYMGGVSHPLKFLCSPSSLDHGVLLVGFGEHRTRYRKKQLPYWLVKNSWGKSWGEQGYYRVFRGDGSCGVNMMASSAIIE